MSHVSRKSTALFLPPLALVIVVLFNLAGCIGQEELQDKSADRNLRNTTSTFIYNMIPPHAQADISPDYSAAVNGFSVRLLEKIYNADSYRGKNVIVSPFCISRNLAIIAEATIGISQQELLDVLGGRAALDDAKTALSRLLYADNSVILQIADAIWVDSTKYSLLPSFRDTANRKYGVESAGLDFGNVQGSVAVMNRWIADNTAGRIKNAVKESYITPLIALFVTSAIYFEADWTSPFDVTKTEPFPFSSPAGSVQVQMMTSSYLHQTRKTGDFENVKIYYGTDGRKFFYLDVYMPVNTTIEEFIDQKCLVALADGDSLGYGNLKMPKFFFENEIDLKPMLQDMGVNGIFDPGKSEIAGMASSKAAQDSAHLYLDLIVHTAGIKTDEEGTVAYAVTVSSGATGSTPGPASPDVVLDRPFVYFIRAGATGLVLFAGVVNNPDRT